MTPEQALGLSQHLVTALAQESQTTARVIAAVPDDKVDYAPHENSMTAGKLAAHIAMVDIWFLESILKGEFSQEEPSGDLKPSELTAIYKEKFPALLEQVKGLSGEHLAKVIPFFGMEYPTVVYLDFCLRHSIHHRGQLSVYLRPMGAKVPSIYGGSYDEPMAASQPA